MIHRIENVSKNSPHFPFPLNLFLYIGSRLYFLFFHLFSYICFTLPEKQKFTQSVSHRSCLPSRVFSYLILIIKAKKYLLQHDYSFSLIFLFSQTCAVPSVQTCKKVHLVLFFCELLRSPSYKICHFCLHRGNSLTNITTVLFCEKYSLHTEENHKNSFHTQISFSLSYFCKSP